MSGSACDPVSCTWVRKPYSVGPVLRMKRFGPSGRKGSAGWREVWERVSVVVGRRTRGWAGPGKTRKAAVGGARAPGGAYEGRGGQGAAVTVAGGNCEAEEEAGAAKAVAGAQWALWRGGQAAADAAFG